MTKPRPSTIVFWFVAWWLLSAPWFAFAGEPMKPPGPRDSWTTIDGYAWNGQRWIRPAFGKPKFGLRPLGSKGLWCDGAPPRTPLERKIQQWEREAYQEVNPIW